MDPKTTRDEAGMLAAIDEIFSVAQAPSPGEAKDYNAVMTTLGMKAWARTDILPGGGYAGRARGKGHRKGEADPAGFAVEGFADDDAGLPWTRMVANATGRMAGHLQSTLNGSKVLGHYSEWCNTACKARPGMAHPDTIVLYDHEGENVYFVKDDLKELDVYLGCPTNLLTAIDPYLLAEMEWLVDIIGSTFWCNAPAYKCCQAALAIAKRGFNVDYVFLLLGSGGVGMSLDSARLAASLGPKLHKYGDPNAFYNDDELRKQVESFQGSIVITFQERPEGSKKAFREDLYKKVATGDTVAGRMPYGIETHMIELNGMTRFELNSILKFTNVTERTFNTVFRRSLLIKFQSQFLDKKYIMNTMGLEKAAKGGVFPWIFGSSTALSSRRAARRICD